MAVELSHLAEMARWFKAGIPAVVIRVAAVEGSSPRDEDAVMAVSADANAGTIGGGQLEWLAIAHARQILAGAKAPGEREIPLGPEIGQCCGGRVRLSFERLDADGFETLRRQAEENERALPRVFVFGAGHTGKALAAALAPLPVGTMLIDTRREALDGLDTPARTLITPLPEEVVREAPAGSAFLTMTHEHSLDFLIVAEALKRGDAAYCGMIGSATKRAVFLNWLEKIGHGRALGKKLVCPIGGDRVADKRPAVIAALTAAEILAVFYSAPRDSIL